MTRPRAPTRDDLDLVSRDIPIYIVHQSNHFGVANTAALDFAGITADSEAPPGGLIRRVDGGEEPSGVLEENAHFLVLGKLLSSIDEEGFKAFARAGSQLWARFGYTTAQEGRATPSLMPIAEAVAASDMLLSAIGQATERFGKGDRRMVLIHGQFMREDQVDSLQRLSVFPSLFPMHTYYWGDWHRDHTVGPERADYISPTGWVRQRGMMFGSHHDAPVAFPDSMRVLDATVPVRGYPGPGTAC